MEPLETLPVLQRIGHARRGDDGFWITIHGCLTKIGPQHPSFYRISEVCPEKGDETLVFYISDGVGLFPPSSTTVFSRSLWRMKIRRLKPSFSTSAAWSWGGRNTRICLVRLRIYPSAVR